MHEVSKSLLFGLFILYITPGFAQEKVNKTENFLVTGDIKKELKIAIPDLAKLPIYTIDELVVYNHLGEKKSVQKNMKGVLLTDVLAAVEFNSTLPKQLSEFYLTIIASDGYKVVYSWNELFNSPTGKAVYLIVEKEGVSIDKMRESILLVTTTDYMTGRRNVKAVSQINIEQVK